MVSRQPRYKPLHPLFGRPPPSRLNVSSRKNRKENLLQKSGRQYERTRLSPETILIATMAVEITSAITITTTTTTGNERNFRSRNRFMNWTASSQQKVFLKLCLTDS